MGRETVYCEGCGKRLSETDFDRGRAQDHDHRPFCSDCRPIVAPPPVPAPPPDRKATERRTASGSTRRRTERIPFVQPASGTRRRPAEGGSSTRVAWAVGGVGAALVVVVAAVMSGRGSRPAPTPETSVAATDGSEQRLRDLEAFAATAADPEAILVRCDQARAGFRGTALEPRFRQVEARALERLKETDRSAELDRSLASIRKIIQDDPGCVRRLEVEILFEAALKTAGTRSGEVQKLQEEYRGRREEAAKRQEAERKEAARKAAEPPPKKSWSDCFLQATTRIQANDYPGAKVIYLEGLATLPESRPEDVRQRAIYCIGLYNLACIYAVESAKLGDKARIEAADLSFKYLDWALRSDYGKFLCPCHPQTAGLGHMGDDKDMDPIRKDARFAELIKKYK